MNTAFAVVPGRTLRGTTVGLEVDIRLAPSQSRGLRERQLGEHTRWQPSAERLTQR